MEEREPVNITVDPSDLEVLLNSKKTAMGCFFSGFTAELTRLSQSKDTEELKRRRQEVARYLINIDKITDFLSHIMQEVADFRFQSLKHDFIEQLKEEEEDGEWPHSDK
jgi:hypothetical protein